ncbi:MAG: hypothetical protein ACLU80_11280 [Dorea sp.]
MLAKIKFSDSIYQIDILPAENENGQFYEMLMAPELDSKVLDDDGFDGQITLGEDTFYQVRATDPAPDREIRASERRRCQVLKPAPSADGAVRGLPELSDLQYV